MADHAKPKTDDQNGGSETIEESADDIDGRLRRIETTVQRLSSLSDVREVEPVPPKRHVKVWFYGVIVASLMPFLPSIFDSIDAQKTPGLYALLGRGELLAISLVFTLAALVELGLSWKRIEGPETWMIGGILLILAEGIWYSNITSELFMGTAISLKVVTFGSIGLFAISAWCSIRCVSLAAGVR